ESLPTIEGADDFVRRARGGVDCIWVFGIDGDCDELSGRYPLERIASISGLEQSLASTRVDDVGIRGVDSNPVVHIWTGPIWKRPRFEGLPPIEGAHEYLDHIAVNPRSVTGSKNGVQKSPHPGSENGRL